MWDLLGHRVEHYLRVVGLHKHIEHKHTSMTQMLSALSVIKSQQASGIEITSTPLN